jgi:hypothetical protein
MWVSLDPGSKVYDDSEEQKAKDILPKTSIEEGIQIEFNDEYLQNASASIRRRFEFDSNVNEEIEEQAKKHSSHRT